VENRHIDRDTRRPARPCAAGPPENRWSSDSE
jgi:hypothetical protein